MRRPPMMTGPAGSASRASLDGSALFLRDGTTMGATFGSMWTSFAPKKDRKPEAHRTEHGCADERVPEPDDPERRIERARNGEEQRQADRKAETLRGLDQPGRKAFLPGLRPLEARDCEGGEADARPERPHDGPGQDPQVARLRGERDEEDGPEGDESRGRQEGPLHPHPVHEPGSPPAAHEEEDRGGREEGEARLEGGEPERPLHVYREEEGRAPGRRHPDPEHVRREYGPAPHEGQWHQGRRGPPLDPEEARLRHGRESEGHYGRQSEEPLVLGVREGVHEQDEPRRDRDRPRDIEAELRSPPVVRGDVPARQVCGERPDRDVHEHYGPPPERLREDAPEQGPRREPRGQDGDDDAEGLVPLRPLRVR